MPTRLKPRRAVMLTFAAMSMAIVLATVPSWWYQAAWVHGVADGAQWGGGALVFGRDVIFAPQGFSVDKVDDLTPWYGLWFRYSSFPGGWQVVAPSWALALVFACPAALIWRGEQRRRRTTGLCPSCGYDRRGLVGGAPCPECGKGAVSDGRPA